MLPSPTRPFQLLFYGALATVTLLAVIPDYDSLPDVFRISDLLDHALAFFGLTALYEAAYRRVPLPVKGLTLWGYGLGLEGIQYCLPTRACALSDWAMDGAAILAGLLACRLYRTVHPL